MTSSANWDYLETRAPEEVIDLILNELTDQRACFTCSFQAEDVVVLHLLRKRLPNIPVLFLETGYHFQQTYEFRDELTRDWNLNLVNVIPKQTVQAQESAFGILYREDPTKCCQLRKVDPLLQSLEPFETWFTGLRREQSVTRKEFEEGRAASSSFRQSAHEGEPTRRLDLGPGMGIHRRTQFEISAAVRSGLLKYRLRTLHRGSRRSEKSALRPLGRAKT